jgi:hypothetical protein
MRKRRTLGQISLAYSEIQFQKVLIDEANIALGGLLRQERTDLRQKFIEVRLDAISSAKHHLNEMQVRFSGES